MNWDPGRERRWTAGSLGRVEARAGHPGGAQTVRREACRESGAGNTRVQGQVEGRFSKAAGKGWPEGEAQTQKDGGGIHAEHGQ